MTNLARNLAGEEQAVEPPAQGTDAEIPVFLESFATLANPAAIQAGAHEFLARYPATRRLELASALSWANPFYVPEMPDESARKLAMNMS